MHPPTYTSIGVTTTLRSESDFAYHLLSQIPKGNAKFVYTRSKDHKVGADDYLKFLSNIPACIAYELYSELGGDVEKREDVRLFLFLILLNFKKSREVSRKVL